MSVWDRVKHKRPYKEGWAYILRRQHRTFRLVPFDPRAAEAFEFEGHQYKIDPELMIRLRRYDPRLDSAKFGLWYVLRWFSAKRIGILKYMEWEKGNEEPIKPEDHIKVIESHQEDQLNPLRFKVTVLEQLANAAFRSIKQGQPLNRKWLIAAIVIIIGVVALLWFLFGQGVPVTHAP